MVSDFAVAMPRDHFAGRKREQSSANVSPGHDRLNTFNGILCLARWHVFTSFAYRGPVMT
jgi:hypothetical protein